MSGDKAGGLASSFALDRTTLSIESDGESLYWSDFTSGALMKLALAGGGAPHRARAGAHGEPVHRGR